MIQFSNSPPVQRFADIQRDVDRRFPAGRFVAVENGTTLADAESHTSLMKLLQAQGKSPQGLVIVQAGAKYPESAVIFTSGQGHA